jgi:hypothetical protein
MLPSRAVAEPDRSAHRALARGIAPAIVLLAIAVWEVVAVARLDAGEATDADWRAAADHVRARRRPGELIVFAPAWADPVGRRWLGDRVPIEDAARMDAARYGTIWEVAIRGAEAPEVAGAAAAEAWRFGGVSVRRFERAAAEVVADLVALAPQAEGARAAASLEEVGFAPRRCVKLVPRPGEPLALTFRDVPLGTRLVGYVGLADVFTRRDVRAPGRLAIAIDGDEVARVEAGVEDGWVRFEVATTPGRAMVVVQASADARDRRICFAAEARR